MTDLITYLLTRATLRQIKEKFGITLDEAMKIHNSFIMLENFAMRYKDKLND